MAQIYNKNCKYQSFSHKNTVCKACKALFLFKFIMTFMSQKLWAFDVKMNIPPPYPSCPPFRVVHDFY